MIMTTLVEGQTVAASSRKPRLIVLGIVLAVAAPVLAGVTANLMRSSLCPTDAWICAGHGIWAQIFAQALPYLAVFPPLLILGVALARSAALALRVLVIYSVSFVVLMVPLWMMAAASYYSLTPRGLVRWDGPFARGALYSWENIVQATADCSSRTLGGPAPVFKLRLIDGVVLDLAAADGFAEHYADISEALAASSFGYDNNGSSEHCPAPYLDLFRAKPGKHS
jgi:hypothetical protein